MNRRWAPSKPSSFVGGLVHLAAEVIALAVLMGATALAAWALLALL